MTEERLKITVSEMEPLLRTLRNGIFAVDAVATSPHYHKIEPNALHFIAEHLEEDITRLNRLWSKLWDMTFKDDKAPLRAVAE